MRQREAAQFSYVCGKRLIVRSSIFFRKFNFHHWLFFSLDKGYSLIPFIDDIEVILDFSLSLNFVERVDYRHSEI